MAVSVARASARARPPGNGAPGPGHRPEAWPAGQRSGRATRSSTMAVRSWTTARGRASTLRRTRSGSTPRSTVAVSPRCRRTATAARSNEDGKLAQRQRRASTAQIVRQRQRQHGNTGINGRSRQAQHPATHRPDQRPPLIKRVDQPRITTPAGAAGVRTRRRSSSGSSRPSAAVCINGGGNGGGNGGSSISSARKPMSFGSSSMVAAAERPLRRVADGLRPFVPLIRRSNRRKEEAGPCGRLLRSARLKRRQRSSRANQARRVPAAAAHLLHFANRS